MPKINYCELKRIHIGSIKTHRCRLKLKNCKRIDHHLNQRVFQNRRCRETKHISMLEEWKKVCIYGVKFFPRLMYHYLYHVMSFYQGYIK